MQKILLLQALLLTACQSPLTAPHSLDYVFKNFTLSQNTVGIFTKGMCIADVFTILPATQIKKTFEQGEFAEDIYDVYQIHDHDGKLLLTLAPKNNNIHAPIERIQILDSRYTLSNGLGANNTFSKVIAHYPDYRVTPVREYLLVEIKQESTIWFLMAKQKLRQYWWNKNKRDIDKTKIPLDARFDKLYIWW